MISFAMARSGQGGCLFSRVPIPPPRHVPRKGSARRDSRLRQNDWLPVTGARRYQTGPTTVKTIAHFSLTRKHFSRHNGILPMRIVRLIGHAPRATCRGRACHVRPALRRCSDHGRRRHQAGHDRHRPDGLRRHARRGVQGQHHRRPRERDRDASQSDSRQARRRAAGEHRRHRRHERQPVYIDGKLIGAVSYSLGSFPKEPHRRDHADRRNDRLGGRDRHPAGRRAKVHLEFPLTRDSLTAAFRKALNWNRPFADRPSDAQFTGVSALGLSGDQLGHTDASHRDAAGHVGLRSRRRRSPRRAHFAIKASSRRAPQPVARGSAKWPTADR